MLRQSFDLILQYSGRRAKRDIIIEYEPICIHLDYVYNKSSDARTEYSRFKGYGSPSPTPRAISTGLRYLGIRIIVRISATGIGISEHTHTNLYGNTLTET